MWFTVYSILEPENENDVGIFGRFQLKTEFKNVFLYWVNTIPVLGNIWINNAHFFSSLMKYCHGYEKWTLIV